MPNITEFLRELDGSFIVELSDGSSFKVSPQDIVSVVRDVNGDVVEFKAGTTTFQLGGGGGAVVETGPVLTYTSGVLTRIDYDSGNYKLFTYTSGVLTQLDYVVGAVTTRKTFNYNPDGSLASIDQKVV